MQPSPAGCIYIIWFKWPILFIYLFYLNFSFQVTQISNFRCFQIQEINEIWLSPFPSNCRPCHRKGDSAAFYWFQPRKWLWLDLVTRCQARTKRSTWFKISTWPNFTFLRLLYSISEWRMWQKVVRSGAMWLRLVHQCQPESQPLKEQWFKSKQRSQRTCFSVLWC